LFLQIFLRSKIFHLVCSGATLKKVFRVQAPTLNQAQS
jgi:hypothetical protein